MSALNQEQNGVKEEPPEQEQHQAYPHEQDQDQHPEEGGAEMQDDPKEEDVEEEEEEITPGLPTSIQCCKCGRWRGILRDAVVSDFFCGGFLQRSCCLHFFRC